MNIPPFPKITEQQLAARKAYERKKKRDEAALTILHALLLKDSTNPLNTATLEYLINEAYVLASKFVDKGEALLTKEKHEKST